MTVPGVPSAGDAYSPQRRTAVVFTGTGTAGAYHAGALRALHEAGVKIDMVAGHGVGALAALFAAIDGGSHLWEEKGYWRSEPIRAIYPWRRSLLLVVLALVLSMAIVIVPIATVALGLFVFPIDFLLKVVGLGGAGGLVTRYLALAEAAFAPTALPTWLPRLVLLVIGAAVVVLAATSYRGWRVRRPRGRFWWQFVPAPLTAEPAVERCWAMMWNLVRGAAALKPPPRADLARRYVELLADNLGQPGFRELLLLVHDVDVRRDLVFALVAEPRRRALVQRSTTAAADRRRAEVLDLAGAARDHLADAIAAAFSIPLATEYHAIQFTPDSHWRGEVHRLADRPGGLERIVAELTALDVEQIVLVSASAELVGPHALAAPRLDGKSRLGEFLQSSDAAVVRDVLSRPRDPGTRLFTIRPAHNPVGPFDFAGGFDDGSVRTANLEELMSMGYSDAYQQFVEPVVGASGDSVGAGR
jgi:hypothetical protein